jgi:hypothetical protein
MEFPANFRNGDRPMSHLFALSGARYGGSRGYRPVGPVYGPSGRFMDLPPFYRPGGHFIGLAGWSMVQASSPASPGGLPVSLLVYRHPAVYAPPWSIDGPPWQVYGPPGWFMGLDAVLSACPPEYRPGRQGYIPPPRGMGFPAPGMRLPARLLASRLLYGLAAVATDCHRCRVIGGVHGRPAWSMGHGPPGHSMGLPAH